MQTMIAPGAFHSALLRGAYKVERMREELNRINGFPVPDRDTGNNLAYLMQQLRRQLLPSESFAELLSKLSEASLSGARGNSGAIFSQYFAGFKEAAADVKDSVAAALPLQVLAQMFKAGYTFAYRSIQQPREGTILSAMRSFADGFHGLLLQGVDLLQAAEGALDDLRHTVRQSAGILPQQRALKAPDAGAMAFLYFAEGFLNALLGREEAESEADITMLAGLAADMADDVYVEHGPDEQSTYRYCTEVLVKFTGENDIHEGMKAKLAALGDSMVVSRSGGMARVHLHTDTPQKAVDLMEELGTLLEVKADDMRMQQALAQKHPGKTALVIDSIADVPEDSLGPDVYCLPLHLLIDGVSFQDKRTISQERMKRSSGRMTSSQVNLEGIRQFLDPILASYDKALILTVSSKMSGLFARYSEYIAANPTAAVYLVDSLVNSGAQGLLARYAADRLHEGEEPGAVAQALEALRKRTKILVSLPSLKAMVASGRLNGRIGGILMRIGFLPLVTINAHGEGTVTGLSFSRKRSDKLLLDKLRPGSIERYALVHAGDEKRARQAAGDIKARIGMEPDYICEISSVVTNFAGEGAYAVAYIEKEKDGKKPL